MKKFLGLLLCCTAFAYNGERLNFEVPAGLDHLEETSQFDPDSHCGYFGQIWTGEAGLLEASSHSYYLNEDPMTVDYFLSLRNQVEILEKAENGVTFLATDFSMNQEITRLIITENGYHTLSYVCEDPISVLSYIQNAEVGAPKGNCKPYKGKSFKAPAEEADYYTMSSPSEHLEYLERGQWSFYSWNELQGEGDLNFYSLPDLYIHVKAMFIGPFSRSDVWNFELLEQSESEMLYKIRSPFFEDDEHLTTLMRLVVTPETRHFCILTDLLENQESAREWIKNLEIVAE